MTSPKECAICKRPIIPDQVDTEAEQWVCEKGHITQIWQGRFAGGATYYGPSLRSIRKAFKERKGDKNDNTT